jgi:hypothetical protein
MYALFKSIMVVAGAITGVVFIVIYFKKVSYRFLSNGIKIGLI